MVFHPDPEHPGHFLEEFGDFREDISRHEIILEKKKEKKLPDRVAQDLKSRAIESAKRELGGKKADKKADKKKELDFYQVLLSEALASMPEPEEESDDEGTLSHDIAEQVETLNSIHQIISHEFLQFWNQKLLAGVEKEKIRVNQVNQYPGFPSILKSAEGGSRRTRKLRR